MGKIVSCGLAEGKRFLRFMELNVALGIRNNLDNYVAKLRDYA